MENFAQSFYTWYKQTMRHPKYRWLLIGGTLVYLISPIDIAPDFIPVIGWIDDAAIATLLVAELSQVFLGYLNQRGNPVKSDVQDPNNIDVRTIDVES
ncbi:MAG: YkvA family protein [Cyanobacteria bacterium J06626_4]